jgi:hypothetical protein
VAVAGVVEIASDAGDVEGVAALVVVAAGGVALGASGKQTPSSRQPCPWV